MVSGGVRHGYDEVRYPGGLSRYRAKSTVDMLKCEKSTCCYTHGSPKSIEK